MLSAEAEAWYCGTGDLRHFDWWLACQPLVSRLANKTRCCRLCLASAYAGRARAECLVVSCTSGHGRVSEISARKVEAFIQGQQFRL